MTIDDVFSDENRRRVSKTLSKVGTYENVASQSKLSRHAAVLMPLCISEGKPSVLVTQRSFHLTRGSGEICFPGGVCDANDKNVIETALREAKEEIGLESERVEVWGHFNPVTDGKGTTLIHPILCSIGNVKMDEWTVNPDEVHDVLIYSLETLCNPHYQRQTQFRLSLLPHPVFLDPECPNRRVWGVTAFLIHLTLSILIPQKYKLRLQHFQPIFPPARPQIEYPTPKS